MQPKTKKNLHIAAIIFLVAVGLLLNHSSYDISWYYPESPHQQEAIERGRLNVLGPFTYDIDFNGSVVSPVSAANDVRTWIIDGILLFLGKLIIQDMQKNA